MIQTSLSPNTQKQDLLLALSHLLLPWNWLKWRKGPQVKQLEGRFKQVVESNYAISFNSGREALYAALKAVDVQESDEVILQPYTCIVVPHAIIKCGATPVYADVRSGTFNINPEDIARKITENTKAIIIQHTFGQAAEVEAIKHLCDRHNVSLIEDCAHTIGGRISVRRGVPRNAPTNTSMSSRQTAENVYQSGAKPIGSFGDVAIWSFGRDKVISAVWGGMLTTNNKDLHGKAQVIHNQALQPSRLSAFQSIMHPLVFVLAKPLYNITIGKLILVTAQKLGIINKVISSSEKSADVTMDHPRRMNNVNAAFALSQLKRLKQFNAHRIQLSQQYKKLLSSTHYSLPTTHPTQPLLRYPILVKNAHQVYQSLLQQGIQLGNWYHNILEPECDPSQFGYTKGSCPEAEKLCQQSLNLPLHPQMTTEQAKTIVKKLTVLSNKPLETISKLHYHN